MKFYSFYSFIRSLILEKATFLSKRENYERLVMGHRQRVNYLLPTFLVSFPRSGSNFLQSILEKSSGLYCRSIYSEFHNSPHYFLSLKSHATSYKCLLGEREYLLPCMPEPSKFILLHRDPHDVMISYYEFTQMKKNTQIDQREFLNKYTYFMPALVQKDLRKLEYTPLSIGQAYKKHVRSWFVQPSPHYLDCLVVKYEDLVQEPQKEFQRIFDFLELQCALAEQFIDIKVSLYSSELRKRGQVYGWKDNISCYKTLLKAVDCALRDEIIALGYQPEF